jgi:hypothetical protein
MILFMIQFPFTETAIELDAIAVIVPVGKNPVDLTHESHCPGGMNSAGGAAVAVPPSHRTQMPFAAD